jgi:hypothetical protein
MFFERDLLQLRRRRQRTGAPEDLMDPATKPRAGEWYRPIGPDKFVDRCLSQP